MICYGVISYVENIPMMPADKSLIMGLTQSFLVPMLLNLFILAAEKNKLVFDYVIFSG